MPRNMSFALTTEQFKNRTKTVTRRKGWKFLKPGDVVMGCKKCMGLKPGEKLERLGRIRIIDTRREDLSDMTFDPEYGQIEVVREGFPGMTPDDFVSMFVDHMGGDVNQEVTRIEYEYL
ncbi:MAG: hypothetical protein AB2792_23010 [Candidatus Thiodiazotropha sp.]